MVKCNWLIFITRQVTKPLNNPIVIAGLILGHPMQPAHGQDLTEIHPEFQNRAHKVPADNPAQPNKNYRETLYVIASHDQQLPAEPILIFHRVSKLAVTPIALNPKNGPEDQMQSAQGPANEPIKPMLQPLPIH